MRDLDLKTLRLFVGVCEHGQLRQAAEAAHIEPSAVSKRLAQLEERLGLPLLTRGRRGAQPTAAGLTLLEHARALLYQQERLAADLAAFRGGLRGLVRVAASVSAIAESLTADVAAFLREAEHAQLQVDIEEQVSSSIVEQVQAGRAALGVCWAQVDFGRLATRPYRRDRLVLAVPARHPLARERVLRFEDSLAHDQVALGPHTAVYRLLHRAAAEAGQTLRCRATVSNFDAAFRVVAAGLGVAVVPRELGLLHAAGGALVLVELSNPWAERRFAICHRAGDELSPVAARLADWLQARAAADQGLGQQNYQNDSKKE
jgi:DNA-binding transcriptional LysR family regulator